MSSSLVETQIEGPQRENAASKMERLSLPFPARLPVAIFAALVAGGALGLSQGGKMAGMRFRAEHAHVFPTTTTGWYFYHKTKNYHIMLGGLKEGLKMGARVSFWAGSLLVVEEALDRSRRSKSFLSTTIAGLSVAGAFSAWSICNLIHVFTQGLPKQIDSLWLLLPVHARQDFIAGWPTDCYRMR